LSSEGSEKSERGKMTITAHNRHWYHPEYGTTFLAGALRAEVGLEQKTSAEYLAEGDESTSGLYLANPYMIDWVLAYALPPNVVERTFEVSVECHS
jgi:hypothetical protein